MGSMTRSEVAIDAVKHFARIKELPVSLEWSMGY